MKSIYVIIGSEDGPFKVVSNKTKAYDTCLSYVGNIHVIESKYAFMKDLRNNWSASLSRDIPYYLECTAQHFYLD